MFPWSKTARIVSWESLRVWKSSSAVCWPDFSCTVHTGHFWFCKEFPTPDRKHPGIFHLGIFLRFYRACVVVFGALCKLTHDASGVCVTQVSQVSHQKQLGDVLDPLILDVTLSRKLFSRVRNINKVSVTWSQNFHQWKWQRCCVGWNTDCESEVSGRWLAVVHGVQDTPYLPVPWWGRTSHPVAFHPDFVMQFG